MRHRIKDLRRVNIGSTAKVAIYPGWQVWRSIGTDLHLPIKLFAVTKILDITPVDVESKVVSTLCLNLISSRLYGTGQKLNRGDSPGSLQCILNVRMVPPEIDEFAITRPS